MPTHWEDDGGVPRQGLEGGVREVLEGHGEPGLAWNCHLSNHHDGVLL